MGTDWKRALVALTATVMTVAIVAGMYWARPVLIPVALAVFLTFVLSPLVTRLQRFKLGRPVEVLLAVGLLVAVTGGVGGLIVSEVAELADTLPDRREAIKGKLVAAKSWVIGDGGGRYTQLIDDLSEALTPDGQNKRPEVIVASAPTSFTERAEGYFHPAVEALGAAALTFILTLFMLLKREDLRNRAISLIGHGRVTTTTKAVDDASQRISKYLVSQLTLNASFGLLIAGGLFALGVEHAILWGFIAGLMRYVPYAGIWIGMLPPLLFSVATAPEWGGGWGEPLSVLGLFVVLETLSANFIEPKVYGHSTGVSEVAQLIAAAMWAFLWGPIGLILSGPLTVCLLVLGRHVTQFNFFVVLLGDQPALEPKVSFYQRLAARDQDEASDIAMEAARESGPDAALDEVIVPALCMARRDSVTGDLDPKALAFAVRAASEIAEEVAEADRPAGPAPTAGLPDEGRRRARRRQDVRPHRRPQPVGS